MRIVFIFALIFAWTAYGAETPNGLDPEQYTSYSISIEHAEQLINDAYRSILKRAPDQSGMETYIEYLVNGGKDAAWLHEVLRNSREGKRIRQQQRQQRNKSILLWGLVISVIATAVRYRNRLYSKFKTLSPDTRQYLGKPIAISSFAAVFILIYTYTYIKSTGVQSWMLYAILMFVLLTAVRLPRWVIYKGILIAMVAFISWSALIDSKGPHDAGSDRDDGVEIAASALMRGNNPWNERTQLGLRITTGPSSIMLAVPFVAAFGEINLLTLAMWTAFLLFLLYGDATGRNNSFPTSILLLAFPWFGFLHTLHWSLDELYYGAIISPILWFALKHRRLFIAGLVGSFICFVRLSYAPMVFAAGLWWVFDRKRSIRDYFAIASGGLLYCVFMLFVFWGIGGGDFWTNNFWHNSQMQSLSNTNNAVTTALSSLLERLPAGPVGSMVIVIPLILIAAIAMRKKVEHPFYHMSVAGLLGHTIAFSPHFTMDYQLIFMIPAIYGVAFTRSEASLNNTNGKETDPPNHALHGTAEGRADASSSGP